MQKKIKIVVTGAAGQVAYSTLFRLASGQAFGKDVALELRLLDVPQALTALQGIKMELEDCAFPLLEQIIITTDVKTAMQDVDWAVLIGAMPRKAGMERADLLKINAEIFRIQGRILNEVASKDIKILVVGNPANTNCLIAMNYAPQIPHERFYGLMLLDEMRARYQLAVRANVNVTAITDMIVWGNHSPTLFADFYHAKINNMDAMNVIKDEVWFKNEFLTKIGQRGAAIIKAKGTSSAASAANAVIATLYQLTHETGQTFSLACCSNGEYEIDPGLIFSFPCKTIDGQVKITSGIEHNLFAKEKIKITLGELLAEKQALKDLKLI